jgi:hypothetical protein
VQVVEGLGEMGDPELRRHPGGFLVRSMRVAMGIVATYGFHGPPEP